MAAPFVTGGVYVGGTSKAIDSRAAKAAPTDDRRPRAAAPFAPTRAPQTLPSLKHSTLAMRCKARRAGGAATGLNKGGARNRWCARGLRASPGGCRDATLANNRPVLAFSRGLKIKPPATGPPSLPSQQRPCAQRSTEH